MVKIIDVARATAPEMSRNCIWITSANDSRHKDNSLHYKNKAFDIRVFNIKAFSYKKARAWVKRMQEELGEDYDVIFETNPDHIHAEFQPEGV
jgi:hypothetical protein